MSTIRTVSTGIEQLDKVIAKEVLKRIAQQSTGNCNGIYDDGKQLTWRPNGYSFFTVRTDGSIIYDQWNAPISGEKFKRNFIDYYMVEKFTKSLGNLGYSVEEKQTGDELVLAGVAW